MKRFITVLVCAAILSIGCGSPKTINGKKYPTVGVFTDKSPKIHYEVSMGNAVWSALLFPSIVFPVYFIGFSLWNPVCPAEYYVEGEGCQDTPVLK